jgi:hypothetical protein
MSKRFRNIFSNKSDVNKILLLVKNLYLNCIIKTHNYMIRFTASIMLLFQLVSCRDQENKNNIIVSKDPSKVELKHIYSYVNSDEQVYNQIEIFNENEYLTYSESVSSPSGTIKGKGSIIRDGNKLLFKKIQGDGPEGIIEYTISLNNDSVILTNKKGINYIQDDEMIFVKNKINTPNFSKVKTNKPQKLNDKKILALLKQKWSTKESDLLVKKPKVLLNKSFEKRGELYLFIVLGFENINDCHACAGTNDAALLKFKNGSYELVDYLDDADMNGYGNHSYVSNVQYFGNESICVELERCGGHMGFEGCLSVLIGNYNDKLIKLTTFNTQLKENYDGDNKLEKNFTREYKFEPNGSILFDLIIVENDLIKKRKQTLTHKFNESTKSYDVKN